MFESISVLEKSVQSSLAQEQVMSFSYELCAPHLCKHWALMAIGQSLFIIVREE